MGEGLGNYRHGQSAELFSDFSHHRCGAGTCAAAHTCCNKHHVRAAQSIFNPIARFFRQLPADRGLHAGTQTGFTDLNHVVRTGLCECLSIGVGDDEFNAGHASIDHVLNRIAASATDADNLDDGAFGIFQHNDFHD